MNMANKILLVDNISNECGLIDVFTKEGYDCVCVDSDDVFCLLDDNRIGCVIIHINTNKSCFDVCKSIRRESKVPVIVFSDVANSNDAIQSLNLGADDFLVKPCDPYEVLARIKAISRRSRVHMMAENISIGPLKIDMDNLVVYVDNIWIHMPPREMKLLHFIATNHDKVLSRKQILEEVWGFDFFGDSRTVDVHIKRIREKMEKVTDRIRISTVWGIGYKFECFD